MKNFLQTSHLLRWKTKSSRVVKECLLLNYARYLVRFFLSGDVEINDVLDELKIFGKIIEMTWKTLGNTAIITGEYNVYLEIFNAENLNLIPPYLEIGG